MMIHFDKQQLARTAREKGFVRDTYEKVLRLASVLRDFSEDEILSQHLVLKGGTAINLMFVNVPRLSVDIDLDVIADVMGDELQELRKVLTQRITSLMGKEGYLLSESSRFSFSLDSFLFDYVNAGGNRDHLKVELNYSLRSHLFEPRLMELNEITMQNSLRVLTLDPMEIYAAKANALMSRAAARDLYDFSYMVERNPFDRQENLFRKSIVFYSSISAEKINKTFDTSAIDAITISKIKRELFPVLSEKGRFDLDRRKKECIEYLQGLMKLEPGEMEYIERFEQGVFQPELLFDDTEIIARIRNHPMALWKCSKNRSARTAL